MPDLCLIGVIASAHGIRGAVFVHPFSDIPGRFERLETVLLGDSENETREYHIAEASDRSGRILLQFTECDDRTTAESLKGLNLYIPEDRMETLPEGRYFVHDLIGCRVETVNGEKRGVVFDVMLLPANDVYVVDYEGREVLIPAVPAFVREVNIDDRRITIEPIPGMFEDTDED